MKLDLDEIERLVNEATPGEWLFDSYSRVISCDQAINHAYRNPPKDMAGDELEKYLYENEPDIAYVPAEYGDTATGRHKANAQYIAHLHPERVKALVKRIRDLEKVKEAAEHYIAMSEAGEHGRTGDAYMDLWALLGVSEPKQKKPNAVKGVRDE